MEPLEFVSFRFGFGKLDQIAFGKKGGQQGFVVFGQMAAASEFFQELLGGSLRSMKVESIFEVAPDSIRDQHAESIGVVEMLQCGLQSSAGAFVRRLLGFGFFFGRFLPAFLPVAKAPVSQRQKGQNEQRPPKPSPGRRHVDHRANIVNIGEIAPIFLGRQD